MEVLSSIFHTRRRSDLAKAIMSIRSFCRSGFMASGRFLAARCPSIEAATNGLVRCEDPPALDVVWHGCGKTANRPHNPMDASSPTWGERTRRRRARRLVQALDVLAQADGQSRNAYVNKALLA